MWQRRGSRAVLQRFDCPRGFLKIVPTAAVWRPPIFDLKILLLAHPQFKTGVFYGHNRALLSRFKHTSRV